MPTLIPHAMTEPSSEDLDFSVVLIRETPEQKLGMVYIVKEPSLAVEEVKPNGLDSRRDQEALEGTQESLSLR